jgi:hypothetical protein
VLAVGLGEGVVEVNNNNSIVAKPWYNEQKEKEKEKERKDKER